MSARQHPWIWAAVALAVCAASVAGGLRVGPLLTPVVRPFSPAPLATAGPVPEEPAPRPAPLTTAGPVPEEPRPAPEKPRSAPEAPPPRGVGPRGGGTASRRMLFEGMWRGLSAPAADAAERRVEFVYVPPGEFVLGRTDEERRLANIQSNGLGGESSFPPNLVRVREGFFFSRYEVTRGQIAPYFKERRERSPKAPVPPWWDEKPDPEMPATGVSWGEATEFAAWLARRSGLAVRLPTEIEWEYAARGHGGTQFARADGLEFRPPERGPERVGRTAGDRSWCGASDLCGNVSEWCADVFRDDEYKSLQDRVTRPGGAYGYTPPVAVPRGDKVQARVVRGGAFGTTQFACEAASRHKKMETDRWPNLGVRLVIIIPGDALAGD